MEFFLLRWCFGLILFRWWFGGFFCFTGGLGVFFVSLVDWGFYVVGCF